MKKRTKASRQVCKGRRREPRDEGGFLSHFFGWLNGLTAPTTTDILFTSGPDNNGPGDNTAALRVSVFNYFASNWSLDDAGGGTDSGLSSTTTGAAGMTLDLTLTSPTSYSLTLTPLNGGTPYTQAGTLAGPISWVDYRLWDGTSGGPNDTANNFEISVMSISVPEPSGLALAGLGSLGWMFFRRRK